jgi:hypothetical protein
MSSLDGIMAVNYYATKVKKWRFRYHDFFAWKVEARRRKTEFGRLETEDRRLKIASTKLLHLNIQLIRHEPLLFCF